MIFITGDTHGDFTRFSRKNRCAMSKIHPGDTVIICGDFGGIWSQTETPTERYWINWLEDKPFTVCFIDGNHENFDRIDKFPIETWNGGRVHKIRPSVIHMMRGEFYDIEGTTIFTFGGASSHDVKDGIVEPDDPRIKQYRKQRKEFRVKGVSWWPQECISDADITNAEQNMAAHNYRADIIISHTPPSHIAAQYHRNDATAVYMSSIQERMTYHTWYAGHIHTDRQFNNIRCIYHDIVPIKRKD